MISHALILANYNSATARWQRLFPTETLALLLLHYTFFLGARAYFLECGGLAAAL
jgi:hypothetical protein